jgi:hypothetical protein
MADPLIDRLAELRSADPDPVRSARTRERCRTALARRTAPSPAPDPQRRRRWPTLWPHAVTILGALYLVQALVLAFRFYATR